ncbi:Ger(x)C family spore germination protein [Paenibacillus whitsoniae]|uniref:Ger(X)C family spore germination protein n=1 Tax=Paenibacillus whitsoniae TaxID=2496558 RepID=A0A430J6J7_9BACL|nr:Ger(x)C family spore germination protein [Paenibacillus whitsoniae]RTE04431.1 Ger(x)C family spore germination protein [Paenibacillus whitsoniae]
MSFRIWCTALLLTALGLLLGGCGFKDIDKRFFVVAMGIDLSDNKDKPYDVTLRLAVPASKVGEGLAESQIEHQEAQSIAEAVRNLKAHVDKEIDFGHCRVFLFGDKLVKTHLQESLNWLARRRDIQLISYVAVAEPTAGKLLHGNPTTERLAGNSFFLTFGKEGTVSPFTVTSFLFDCFRRFKEKGMDPVIPIVRYDGDSYVVEKLSLLDKFHEKLVLTPEETQLFNMSANEYKKSGIPIDYQGQRLALYVSNISSKINITHDTIPTVKFSMNISGMVEQGVLRLDPQEVERKLSQHVSESLEKLLAKIQDAGVDPYGFGLHYLAQYFGKESDWKHWQEVYPEVKFQVNTSVKITNTGLIY